MNIEDVLKTLGRYTSEAEESDQRTAARLGIKRATLRRWLHGADRPKKFILARLAGFLRRVGYL
jgi:transcriptional regulator with XRE-family HTH domain